MKRTAMQMGRAANEIAVAAAITTKAMTANFVCATLSASNENKMSDGGRGRAPPGVKVWKSSQNVDTEWSGVRSIAWLDADVEMSSRVNCYRTPFHIVRAISAYLY